MSNLYRNCVGVLLLNKNNLILVGNRIDSVSSAWQMPQGGIDEGETPIEAAYRELEEEIGTKKVKLLDEFHGWLSYELPISLRKKLWKGKYIGQKQKWFGMRFTGKNSDININTTNPEFKEWRWLEVKKLPSIAVPFKKKIYTRLVSDFYPVLEKMN